MARNIDDMKITRVKAASVAGATAVTSDTVDMAGYDGVLFFTTFGTITTGAVISVSVQQSSDDGVADAYVALTGASHTVADDDDGQTFGIQVLRPRERYLQCVVSRATQNAVVGEIYALRYGAGTKPVASTVTDIATFKTVADAVEAE